MMVADYVFWLAVAFLVGCNLYYSPRITSERMAMQWGWDGEPTWSAPKAITMWGIVAFAIVIRLLIWAAMTYTPDKVHGAETGLLLFSIIVAAVHFWMLRGAARASHQAARD